MNELETAPPEAAAKKAEKGQNALKLIAGLVFLMASVGVLIHSVPRHKYVEAHVDKPRPRPAAKSDEPAPARPQPVKPAPAPAAKDLRAPAAVGQALSGAAASSSDADAVEDWHDACAAEIGILCNGLAEGRQPRCLRQYEDAIRKDCQKALLTLSGAGPE